MNRFRAVLYALKNPNRVMQAHQGMSLLKQIHEWSVSNNSIIYKETDKLLKEYFK